MKGVAGGLGLGDQTINQSINQSVVKRKRGTQRQVVLVLTVSKPEILHLLCRLGICCCCGCGCSCSCLAAVNTEYDCMKVLRTRVREIPSFSFVLLFDNEKGLSSFCQRLLASFLLGTKENERTGTGVPFRRRAGENVGCGWVGMGSFFVAWAFSAQVKDPPSRREKKGDS